MLLLHRPGLMRLSAGVAAEEADAAPVEKSAEQLSSETELGRGTLRALWRWASFQVSCLHVWKCNSGQILAHAADVTVSQSSNDAVDTLSLCGRSNGARPPTQCVQQDLLCQLTIQSPAHNTSHSGGVCLNFEQQASSTSQDGFWLQSDHAEIGVRARSSAPGHMHTSTSQPLKHSHRHQSGYRSLLAGARTRLRCTEPCPAMRQLSTLSAQPGQTTSGPLPGGELGHIPCFGQASQTESA